MSENDKIMFWAAAFHNGYINNKDVNEMLSQKVISNFYESTDLNILKDIDDYDVGYKLKLKCKEIVRNYKSIEEVSYNMREDMSSQNIFAVTENDSDYPYYWHKLSGMPRVIFCKGKRDILKDLDNGSCAVVGSREPSGYALMACSDILGDVLNKKITIVSGMALGIDRCAHKLALEKGGNTIAFLAGGPDNIYPWANKDIYDQMCYRGLIVSEMPPGTKAQRQYFPSRNRLISAISDVCIIMEAGIHSGTLHTASFAVSQGKGVYVLPNTIYSENAQGGLKLIQDGATILINSDDIINDVAECCYFRLLEKRGEIDNAIIPGSEEEMNDDQYKSLIIKELSTKPQTSDMLCTRINLPFYRITALLSELEMNGRVEQSRGKFLLTISKQ